MRKLLLSMVVITLVCCDKADATSDEKAKVADDKWVYVSPTATEINLDDMTFVEAFRIEYLAKGEGRTFWWRGEQYTTNLADADEFVIDHLNNVNSVVGWVTNDNDLDDNCYSNMFDECGVCDGPGKITWYRDADGDGLGNVNESIKTCTYPKDVASR